MPLKVVDEKEFQEIDLTKPLPIDSSPMMGSAANPVTMERAQALMTRMQNPIELQQYTVVELRMAVEQRIKRDLDDLGMVSDGTMEWLVEMNKALSDLHKNLYGTKAVQVNVQGKVSLAQLGSIMRSAQRDDRVVDVEPADTEDRREEPKDVL